MNETKYASFRAKLEKIRFSIIGEVQEKYKSKKNQLNESVADIADDAVQSYDRQMMMGLGEKDLTKLRLVEEAIEKLDNGQYGVCSECEELIPEGRLILVPFALHCVDCLEIIENKNSGV
jgi:DnaK suppressor protein